MKLHYKPIEQDSLSSIYIKRIQRPYVGGNWHFHKEFELIYFLKGQGIRIVGDHISNFQKGELVLVGEWLPHLWRNDVGTLGEVDVDFIVLKFSRDFAGVPLFLLPELSKIRQLLKKAEHGIFFPKEVLPNVHKIILQLSASNSAELLINFLSLLQTLSSEKNYQLLSSQSFPLTSQASEENRLQKVVNYISHNYNRAISLSEIADIAYMTPPAFCRFFKSSTNKTFSHFLNEYRVGKACQLLINDEKSIKEICYDAGFSSLTNFNRAFKKFKSMTPGAYRARYRSFTQ